MPYDRESLAAAISEQKSANSATRLHVAQYIGPKASIVPVSKGDNPAGRLRAQLESNGRVSISCGLAACET